MARRNYAFVRAEMPNFDQLRAAGWDTPLFAANDPRLAQQVAAARAAGVNYGLWADPNWYEDKSAEGFARQMAALNQLYHPVSIVPDIEFIGKGYQGSAGWNYNQQLADAWRRYLPGVETAITPMGMQDDFNYEAWKGIVSQWLPQSYGANSNRGGDRYNPQDIFDTLVRRGVDPALISPVLAQSSGNFLDSWRGPAGLWTYDDFMIGDLPNARRYQSSVATSADRAPASAGGPAAPVARRPKLSQSAEMIGQQGLKWFGKTYQNETAFRQALNQRGQSYDRWAREHPTAAAALVQKRPPVKPR